MSDPLSNYMWVFCLAVILSAVYIVVFIVNCIKNRKLVFCRQSSPETAKRGIVKELLWVCAVVASGAVIRALTTGGADVLGFRLLTGVGVLSTAAAVFFIVKYLRDKKYPLKYVSKIIKESLWVHWLVFYSSSFTSNFVDLGDEYYPLAWKDCLSSTFLIPVLLVSARVATAALKYKPLLKPAKTCTA